MFLVKLGECCVVCIVRDMGLPSHAADFYGVSLGGVSSG